MIPASVFLVMLFSSMGKSDLDAAVPRLRCMRLSYSTVPEVMYERIYLFIYFLLLSFLFFSTFYFIGEVNSLNRVSID